MSHKKISDNLDAIANEYHKTKDPYYKDLWYKKIKEWNERNRTLRSPIYHPIGQRSYKRSDRFDGTYYATRLSEHESEIKDLVAVYDEVRNLWIMEHGSGTLVGHTCVQDPTKM
jgi:hypothetical protein